MEHGRDSRLFKSHKIIHMKTMNCWHYKRITCLLIRLIYYYIIRVMTLLGIIWQWILSFKKCADFEHFCLQNGRQPVAVILFISSFAAECEWCSVHVVSGDWDPRILHLVTLLHPWNVSVVWDSSPSNRIPLQNIL